MGFGSLDFLQAKFQSAAYSGYLSLLSNTQQAFAATHESLDNFLLQVFRQSLQAHHSLSQEELKEEPATLYQQFTNQVREVEKSLEKAYYSQSQESPQSSEEIAQTVKQAQAALKDWDSKYSQLAHICGEVTQAVRDLLSHSNPKHFVVGRGRARATSQTEWSFASTIRDQPYRQALAQRYRAVIQNASNTRVATPDCERMFYEVKRNLIRAIEAHVGEVLQLEHRQLLETTEELNLKCETMLSQLQSNFNEVVGDQANKEADIEAEELISRASGFTLIELELDKVKKKQQDSLYCLAVQEEPERIRGALHQAVRSLVVKKRGLFSGSDQANPSKYIILPKRKNSKFFLCDLVLRKTVEHSVSFAFPHSGAALLHLPFSLVVAGGQAGGLFFHQVSEIKDNAQVKQLAQLLTAKSRFPLTSLEKGEHLFALGGLNHCGELDDAQQFIRSLNSWKQLPSLRNSDHAVVACGVGEETVYSIGPSSDLTSLEWERLNFMKIKEGWKLGALSGPPIKLRRGDGGIMVSDKKLLVFGNKFALQIGVSPETIEVEKSLSTSFNFNSSNLVPAKVFGQAVYALGGNDFSKIYRYVESQGVWERV